MNDINKLQKAIEWLEDKKGVLTILMLISIIVAIGVATPFRLIVKNVPPVGIFVTITYISTILLSVTRLTGIPLLTVYRKHIIEHRYEKIITQKELVDKRLTEHIFLQETLNDMIRYSNNQLRYTLAENEVEKIISVVNEHWENKPIRHISQTMAKKLDTISFYYADLLRYLKEENASKQVTDRIADEINPVLMNELDSYDVKVINDELIKEFEDKPLTAIPTTRVVDVLVKAVTDNIKKG
jgi:hypothetical protein